MTQILGNEKQGPVFEIVSARISDDSEEKKHVIYTLQVRHISGNDDLSPSVIERRYTHFLALYTALRKEQPQLMANTVFPKKVLMGNFDNELISTRSTGFESLLRHVSSESKLRASKALVDFLQGPELEGAKALLERGLFADALQPLENCFRLLNKVFTDRSPAVLLALCRLLGCCVALPDHPEARKWAELALHRFEGVSDGDLLELYVPLLRTCSNVCEGGALERRLGELKRQGVRVDNECSLLEQVNRVEGKIFGP